MASTRPTRGKNRTSPRTADAVSALDTLTAVLRAFQDADVTELDFEDERVRIRLSRQVATILASPPSGSVPHRAAEQPPQAPHSHVQATHTEQRGVDGHLITSPFVGTFYRAANPTAGAFVQLGSVVKKGQTLCIIEAMKLMNEIEADEAGKVAEILVENGQPVEFGQKLFRMVPA
jgi:acetyl-CoA carboxylase biotin carboxyl carrier protein